MPSEISREQLEKVIHRAAELQFGQGDKPDSLEADEVLRIAEEVGLEGRHVRQALAEMRADALLPAQPGDRSLATRLWGEAMIVESRVVPGDPDEVLSRRGRYLADRESLRCVRDRPGQQVWEPASDLMSQIQRGLDFSGRGYELASAKTLTVLTQPLEEGRTLVSVIADISNTRTGHAFGWYGGNGIHVINMAIWVGAAGVAAQSGYSIYGTVGALIIAASVLDAAGITARPDSGPAGDPA